jgi:hypothetical protein
MTLAQTKQDFHHLRNRLIGRGLHSFPFQLNLSSSVHRIAQVNS